MVRPFGPHYSGSCQQDWLFSASVIFSQFLKTFVTTHLSTFIVHIWSFFSSISIANREYSGHLCNVITTNSVTFATRLRTLHRDWMLWSSKFQPQFWTLVDFWVMFLLFFNSWNRSGHKFLSASTDCVVSVWDVLTGECDYTFRFPSPVLKVQFHPRDRCGGQSVLRTLLVIYCLKYCLNKCTNVAPVEAWHNECCY